MTRFINGIKKKVCIFVHQSYLI